MAVQLNMFNKFIATLFISSILVINSNGQAETGLVSSQMTAVNNVEWETRRQQYLPNIVVVDMWAMWCSSCIERYPEMVKLHEKYKNQNIEFVSMNLDDREDLESLDLADKFLKKMKANFDHYRMDENLLYAFEKLDLLGIPAVLIYDENGKEQYRLTGDNPNKQFTEKDIEEAIKELLDNND
ncbi:MAG: TlpA disulfide reductase family protein [Gammaproteobacteria bacterium]